MPKTALILTVFLFSLSVSLAQGHIGIGYTGGSINGNGGVAGGMSLALGYNFAEWNRSSFTISTNAKLGFQDKSGSALLIPLAVASSGNPSPSGSGDGGTVHLFTELPLLLHYNYGFGSTSKLDPNKAFGFYLGGGFTTISTGYADTAGYSRAASFSGWVIDGGIRFSRKVDLNFATVISTQGSIGPIQHPLFFEVTLSAIFPR